MSTLSEKLIGILERDRNPTANTAPLDMSVVLPTWDPLRYNVGTVFHSTDRETYVKAAILVRVSLTQCMLICLPGGNRWSDIGTFDVSTAHDGPTKEEFHKAFDDKWEVSRRGKEALEEWARTDI
jgi:hypothetical protein